MIQYRQCHLHKPSERGHISRVSWLPTQFPARGGGKKVKLRVGSVVDLKEEDGSWSTDWEILSCGEPKDEAPDWRALVKGHRKNTGDSIKRGQ